MKYLGPIVNNNDLVNKKYVDDKIASSGIIDVNSLPAITNANRNCILRYNGKLYYVKTTETLKNIEVGDDLSGKTICNTWPIVGQTVQDVLGNKWLDSTTTTLIEDSFITATNGNIYYYRGGATDTRDYVYIDNVSSGDGYFYEMDGGDVSINLVEITLPNNFGTVSSINTSYISLTSFLYTMLFIKTEAEAWVPIDEEVSISDTEPTGEEKIWIDPEDQTLEPEEFVIPKYEKIMLDMTIDSSNSNLSTITVSNLNLTSEYELDILIQGTVSSQEDVLVYFNGASSTGKYCNMGYYYNGTATSDGSFSPTYGMRFAKSFWYFGHSLCTIPTVMKDNLRIIKDSSGNNIPLYSWEVEAMNSSKNFVAKGHGTYYDNTPIINSISFYISGKTFNIGTRIIVKKRRIDGGAIV